MVESQKQTHVIPEDMRFQRRSWIVERISWTVMALLIAAACLGLLTHGPLSETTVKNASGTLALTYERLERREASAHFELVIGQTTPGEEVSVHVGGDFLKTYDLRGITPTPLRSSAHTGGLEAVFAAPNAGELRVFLNARARRFGRVESTVEVPGRGKVTVWQLVFP